MNKANADSILALQLPRNHKVAVLKKVPNGYIFETEMRPMPSFAPSDVLVKLAVTGVCGSDFTMASGAVGPVCDILGHEGVGHIVALGSSVSSSEVSIGQRIGIAWQRDVCGRCGPCLTDGGETRCLASVNSGRNVDGTFAEYAVVPSRYIIRLPDEVSDEFIAPILCGGVTIYKALKICGARAGQWIAISGAGGGMGGLGIQYAKAMGMLVIAIDTGEEKRAPCVEAGADLYVDGFGETNLHNVIRRATNNEGVHAVLVAAGSVQAYEVALGIMAPFGTLVCIGIPSGTVAFSPHAFIDKGYRIFASSVGTRGDILEAIEFVRRGIVTPRVILKTLEDLNSISAKSRSGKLVGKCVIRLEHGSP